MTEPMDEAALYALFAAEGIAWTHTTHPPLHTVAESRALRGQLPGAHVKNLFLKDRAGDFWLATCLEDRRIRIRDLARALGAKDLSFADEAALRQRLGVRPGAVTPLALLNPAARGVRLVLDQGLAGFALLNVHPLHNRATTTISLGDMTRLLAQAGHAPIWADFDALEAQSAAREAGGAG